MAKSTDKSDETESAGGASGAAEPAVSAPNVYFVSLGCPKNRVDTEVMLGQVAKAGLARVNSPDEADVIVVNTCGFIDAAKEESIDTILEMAQYKAKGRCEKLVVTGCLTQRYPDEVAREIPEIDHVLGSADYAHIAAAVSGTGRGATGRGTSLPVVESPRVQVASTPEWIYDDGTPRVLIGARHSVYVKIAEGCDRPCAFCIIPKLRGPQRSRSIDSVVREVEQVVAGGAREINLIAQDLTRYGVDRADRPTLAQLLRRVARVPGVHWVRLHYTYPSAFTDELIDVIADEPTVAKYIDVPLQHIDDDVLKRMRRGHSSRITHELIERLRARIEGLVLRSTFIVGHPGETDEAFARLEQFIGDAEIEHVGAFTYSREQGTVAAMLPGRVEPDVAIERRDRLMELQRQISRHKHDAMVGSELEVLVEGVSDESDLLLQGRWYGQAPEIDGSIYLSVPPEITVSVGEFVHAAVTDASDYDLAADIVDSVPSAESATS